MREKPPQNPTANSLGVQYQAFLAVSESITAHRDLAALFRDLVLLGIMLSVGGAAWMTLTSTFTVAAQTVVPAWMRARALAMYLLVFNGGMAVGSVLWGVIAARASTPLALMSAALGLILGLTTMIRYRLVTGEA